MLSHEEIKALKLITNNQRKMLLVIADYNEGWITESELETMLIKILK